MPRKGENIYKRKDGRWEGRYIIGRKDDGKAFYKSVYASSYTEVKTKLKKQILLQENSQRLLSNKDILTFEEISLQWIKLIKPRIKESSYNKYDNLIQINIIPYIGKKKISDLSTEYMQIYISVLLNGGIRDKPLKARTVKDIISIIKRVFRYAIGLGYVVNCDFNLIHFTNELFTPTVLTREEQNTLVAYLLSSKTLSAAGIYLTLFTGLRIGEICALKWNDIYLDKSQIIVSRTLQRIQDKSSNAIHKTKIVITKPKSCCSERVIPIPDFLASYLRNFCQDKETYFLTGSCQKYMEPRTLQNHLKKILCKLNIENVTFHTLRHTFATRCVEIGFDVKSLSEILGHSNVNITLNRYVHPSDELKREHMEKLSTLLTVK